MEAIAERLRALEASIQEGLRLQDEWTAKLEAILQASGPPSKGWAASGAQAPGADAAASGDETDAVDAVTASIRRAVSDALDQKLEELMGPMLSLHQRLRDEAKAIQEEKEAPPWKELYALLDEVAGEAEALLCRMGGCFIRPETGEFYDPLIHLAVGQAGEGPVEDDARTSSIVTEVLRPGYRSSRGKVVLPARVFVGRK